jgi:hypothetical protein
VVVVNLVTTTAGPTGSEREHADRKAVVFDVVADITDGPGHSPPTVIRPGASSHGSCVGNWHASAITTAAGLASFTAEDLAASPDCSDERPTGHYRIGQPIQADRLCDWIASHDYEHDFVDRKLCQPVQILGEL